MQANPRIKEMWESEDKLTLEQRRARYKAPMKAIVQVKDIPNWFDYSRNSSIISNQKTKFQPDQELNQKIALWKGDITKLEIDAVQNAANTSLLGGGGIDGAIHFAAGKKLVQENMQLGGCETGQTKISRGYNLPAKYVLHTVGPIGEKKDLLKSCYRTTLNLAVKYGIRTLALCGVSTGIYGYPVDKASSVAIGTVRKWLETDDNRNKVDLIVFVVWLDREKYAYERDLPLFFPVETNNAAEADNDDDDAQTMQDDVENNDDTTQALNNKNENENAAQADNDDDDAQKMQDVENNDVTTQALNNENNKNENEKEDEKENENENDKDDNDAQTMQDVENNDDTTLSDNSNNASVGSKTEMKDEKIVIPSESSLEDAPARPTPEEIRKQIVDESDQVD